MLGYYIYIRNQKIGNGKGNVGSEMKEEQDKEKKYTEILGNKEIILMGDLNEKVEKE